MCKGDVLRVRLDKCLLDPSQYNYLRDCKLWFIGYVTYNSSVKNKTLYSMNFIHDQRKLCVITLPDYQANELNFMNTKHEITRAIMKKKCNAPTNKKRLSGNNYTSSSMSRLCHGG